MWFKGDVPVQVRVPENVTADGVSAVYAIRVTGSNQWDLELKVFNTSAAGTYSCRRGNERVSLVIESGELLVHIPVFASSACDAVMTLSVLSGQ